MTVILEVAILQVCMCVCVLMAHALSCWVLALRACVTMCVMLMYFFMKPFCCGHPVMQSAF